MNTRTRPARSTTATEIATLFLAQASIAPSAIASPSFQVMSRWLCTWALDEPGNAHAAIATAVQPNLVHMIKSLPALCWSTRSRWAAAVSQLIARTAAQFTTGSAPDSRGSCAGTRDAQAAPESTGGIELARPVRYTGGQRQRGIGAPGAGIGDCSGLGVLIETP